MKLTTRSLPLLVPVLLVGLWLARSLFDGVQQEEQGLEAVATGQSPQQEPRGELPPGPVLFSARAPAEASERRQREEAAVQSAPTPVSLPPLRGQVLDAMGVPVAGANVGVLDLDAQLAPKGGGERAQTRTNARGEFELALAPWALAGKVLLIARSTGWQPFSRILQIGEAELQYPQVLSLGTGVEVIGRVVRGGLPVVDAAISIDAKYGVPGVFGVGSEAWWAAGQLENKHGHGSTGEDGVFRISGMGAGEFRLDIGGAPGAPASTLERVYTARSSEFRVYDLSASWLRLSVRDAAGPLVGAWVHLIGHSKRHSHRSQLNPMLVEVDPDERLHLEVLHPGYGTLTMPAVRAPLRGETLELELVLEQVNRPTLTVRLLGAESARVDWVSLSLHPGFLGGGLAGPALAPMHLKRRDAEDEFYSPTVDAEPGEYLLVMRASPQGKASSCLITQAAPIHLPVAGDLFVDFDLELMAGYSIDVQVPVLPANGVKLHQWIHNGDGIVLAERHISRQTYNFGEEEFLMDTEESNSALNGSDFGWRFNGAWKPTDSALPVTWGRLPAGSYSLEVRIEGRQNWSQRVTLVAGQVKQFTARMPLKQGR